MLFQGKDGELRILSGSSQSLSILFCEMDYSGPLSRTLTEETLMMNRGVFSTDAHYIAGNDEPRYAPLPLTFSCRLNDNTNTWILGEWISGVTNISGSTQLYTTKGTTTIDGNTLPDFANGAGGNSDVVSSVSSKYAYNVEVLWDGTNDFGIGNKEVYFKPGEQTITESADGVMLSCNAEIYGDVTRITGFTAGYIDVS